EKRSQRMQRPAPVERFRQNRLFPAGGRAHALPHGPDQTLPPRPRRRLSYLFQRTSSQMEQLVDALLERDIGEPSLDLRPLVALLSPKSVSVLFKRLVENGEHRERCALRTCCSFSQRLKQEDVSTFRLPCCEFERFAGFIQYKQETDAGRF